MTLFLDLFALILFSFVLSFVSIILFNGFFGAVLGLILTVIISLLMLKRYREKKYLFVLIVPIIVFLFLILSYSILENKINKKIVTANYCTNDSDCVNVGNLNCEQILINKKEENNIKNSLDFLNNFQIFSIDNRGCEWIGGKIIPRCGDKECTKGGFVPVPFMPRGK